MLYLVTLKCALVGRLLREVEVTERGEWGWMKLCMGGGGGGRRKEKAGCCYIHRKAAKNLLRSGTSKKREENKDWADRWGEKVRNETGREGE